MLSNSASDGPCGSQSAHCLPSGLDYQDAVAQSLDGRLHILNTVHDRGSATATKKCSFSNAENTGLIPIQSRSSSVGNWTLVLKGRAGLLLLVVVG